MTSTPANRGDRRYFNHRLVGAGSEGVIWRADARTGVTPVAIKEYRPGCGVAFYRELRTIQGLNHPNILRLLDFSDEQDRRTIVWEYCSGGTLRRWLESPAGIGGAEFHALFQQLASALAYLGERNVVHGDIKPENTLRARATGAPLWKLGDFGLSSFGIAARQSRYGTLAYQAPEVPLGRRSTASDIYSLGKTMLDALNVARFAEDAEGRQRAALLELLREMTEEAHELRPTAPVVLSRLAAIEVERGLSFFRSALQGAQPIHLQFPDGGSPQ